MQRSNLDCPPVLMLMSHSALDREAYAALIRSVLHVDVAVQASLAPVSIWAAMRRKPDLCVVCADVVNSELRDAVHMVSRLSPATRILAVSALVDPMGLRAWGECSIYSYLVKHAGPDELASAIGSTLAGTPWYSEGTRELIQESRTSSRQKPRLTPREAELLPLLACGLTLREAAARMAVSYKTADSYRTSLLKKLGIRDRVELARYAIREKIVDL